MSSKILAFLATIALASSFGGVAALAATNGPLDNFGTGTAPDEITPEIAALTQGVVKGPEQGIGMGVAPWIKCFNYVSQHIQYEHYYGAKRGAHLTHLDGRGGDADQACLLAAMLRSAGYTVRYGFGVRAMYLNSDPNGNDYTVGNLLGVSGSQFLALCAYRGYAVSSIYADSSTNPTWMAWPMTWVELQNADGTWTQLNPALKKTTRVAPAFNVSTASGHTLAALKTAAGGTTGTSVTVGGVSKPANWVSGISTNGVNTYLNGKSTALQGALGANSTKNPIDILGGWKQVGSTNSAGSSLTFPAYSIGVADTSASALPSGRLTQLTIKLQSTASGNPIIVNYTAPMPHLQGRRLSLVFNASSQAQIMLDDTVVASESTASVGTGVTLTATIAHPYSASTPYTHDQSYTKNYLRGSTYALAYGFDPSPNLLHTREAVLAAYRAGGKADTSREVMSETLNIMGLAHIYETELVSKALAAQNNCDLAMHHRFGVVGQETGYYIDLPMQYSGIISLDGAVDVARLWRGWAYVMSSMEHACLEQMQGTANPAVSTAKLIRMANDAGNRIFLADPSTWANVQTQLTGYQASDIASMNAAINGALPGYALAPKNGSQILNRWKGAGYLNVAQPSSGNYTYGMMISGGLNGGFASYVQSLSPNQPSNLDWFAPDNGYRAPVAQTVTAPAHADPVDMLTGSYLMDPTTDISIGSAAPRGLSFTRQYNSAFNNFNPTGLGYGWTHNWRAVAAKRSAYEPVLGYGGTPMDMAPVLIAVQALTDLNNDTLSATNLTVSALVSNWLTNTLQDNAVSLSLGTRNLQFVKRPDGVYQPAGGVTSTLTATGGGYTLKERNGNTYVFDSVGRLSTMTDLWGKVATLAYTDATATAKVSSVTDAYGRKLAFTYDGSGNLASVGDGTRSATYTYDAGKNLLAAADPEGKKDQFTYDVAHRILQVKNHDGAIVGQNFYNTVGKVYQQYNQGLSARIWLYYYTPWFTTAVAPNYGRDIYGFDDKGRQTYERNMLVTATDYGTATPPPATADQAVVINGTHNTLYAPQAVLTSTKAYDGQDHVVGGVSPTGRTVAMAYDVNHNLLTTTDPAGNVTTNTYDGNNRLATTKDALGNTTRWTYNATHQPLTITRPDSTVITRTYNAAGTLATVKDPAGNTTIYAYDTKNRPIKMTMPDGKSVSTVFNTLDDPTSITDANGNITTTAYNKRREAVLVTLPGNLTTTTSYDDNRNVASITDPKGNVTGFTYSSTGKKLTTTLPDASVISTAYDIMDRPVSGTDPLGNITTTVYLSNGWVGSVTDPLGNTSTLSYDFEGETTQTATPLGRTSQSIYDVRGLVTSTIDPLNQTSTFTYDALGRRTAFADRRSNTTTFAYDGMGRLLKTTTPEGRITSQTYESRGLTSSVAQPSGKTTTFGYDTRGRTVSATDATGTVGRTYDANGNVLTITDKTPGNVVTSTLTRTYDALNRVTGFTGSTATAGGTNLASALAYTYDSNGNLASLTYETGKKVTYVYDNRNRLTGVTDWLGKTTAFTYDKDGRVLALTRPNGTVRTNTWDANGRLTGVDDVVTATGGTVVNIQTGYDADDRLTSKQAWPPLKPTSPLPGNVTNRTATYTPDNKINLITSAGVSPQSALSVSYDTDGNLLASPGPKDLGQATGYQYDARNRLAKTTNPDGTITEYRYDAEGNRVSVAEKTAVGTLTGETSYIVDPNASLPCTLEQIKPDGTKIYYVYGNGSLLYEINGQTNAQVQYHHDHLGSVVATTNGQAQVVGRASYSTYGATLRRVGTWDTPFQWCGAVGVMTDANGLTYMRARYYSASLMRFLNQDPLGLAAGPNCYAYCSGNPVTMFDPSGLNEMIVSGGVNPSPSNKRLPNVPPILDNHDQNWKNFVTAANLKINESLKTVPPGERVEWAYNVESYQNRLEGPLVDQMAKMRLIEDGVIPRPFKNKEEFIKILNTDSSGRPRDMMTAINKFTYYGHGSPGEIWLDYSYYKSDRVSTDDLSSVKVGAISPKCVCDMWSCNSATIPSGGTAFIDAWTGRFGGKATGWVGKTEYSPVADGKYPVGATGSTQRSSCP